MNSKQKKEIRAYIKNHPMSEETKVMLARLIKRSQLGRGQRGTEWYITTAPVAQFHWQELVRLGVIR